MPIQLSDQDRMLVESVHAAIRAALAEANAQFPSLNAR